MAPGRICVFDPSVDEWDVADIGTAGANVTVFSPLQKFGVAVWNNGVGAPDDGIAAICTWGRFWLSPDAVSLSDNTTYYLEPGTEQGGFTDQQPTNSPCHRPIFRHISDGWCIMIDSEPSQHLAWAYEGEPNGSGADPEVRLAEVVFDSAPDTNTDQGVLRFRDREFDESGDVGSGDAPGTGPPERHDGVVRRRQRLPPRHGLQAARRRPRRWRHRPPTSSPNWEASNDRGGVLHFLYAPGQRVGDTWDYANYSNYTLRAIPLAGVHGDSNEGGAVSWQDSGFEYMKWFTHFTVGASAGLTGLDDKRRRIEQFVAHEFWGRDVLYRAFGSDWFDAVLFADRDIPGSANHTLQTLTPGGVANVAAALPLRVREIDICDGDDTVRKILVVCSDMY